MRIAILAHAHREIRAGGAEIAAYALFQQLRERGADATLVALASQHELGHPGPVSAFRGRSDELLWRRPALEDFRFASLDPDHLDIELGQILDRLRPDIVHFHHYHGFSADCLELTARKYGIPTILTLHEYGAICCHFGQMVRRDRSLCEQWSPTECSRCDGSHPPGHLFLRRERLLQKFSSVAAFIAPSHFLADRYASWGLDPERIVVIENPAPRSAFVEGGVRPVRPYGPDDPLRLAYFGQFTPFKGLDVLLRAIKLLPQDRRRGLRLSLHGQANGAESHAYLEGLQSELDALEAVLFQAGPYRNDQVQPLMRLADWIVVPSIWWENSPLVIQEARAAGVPVLCSDIGGMREKVENGVTGAHFLARSPQALADRIAEILDGRLQVKVPSQPLDLAEAQLDEIIAVYRRVREAGRARHRA